MNYRQRGVLVGLMALALVACGTAQTATTAPSSSDARSTDQPVEQAQQAAVANPLCALATLAEVQAAIGGTITKIDVIDVPDLVDVDCVYLDERDFNTSMSIQYATTEKLVKTNSQWPTAAAYFAEWTRSAEQIGGLGEGAAWVDITGSLWVLKGDTVIELSSSSVETADAAIRTKFETLASLVLSRLP